MRLAVMLQVCGVAGAFLLMAAAPPAEGPMLVLPLTAHAAAILPAAVTTRGARLLGRGRLPGSLLVWGRRDRLFVSLGSRGMITLAVTPALCGSKDGSA